MNVSPEEAQASLVAIQQTRAQMRKLAGLNGYFGIIWGLVWFFGCLANQFLPSHYLGWIWGSMSLVGGILSGLLGSYIGTQVHSKLNTRIALFFLSLGGFTLLWFLILEPLSVRQGVLFFLTIISFGGVISGILVRSRASVIGSLAFMALALIGYYLVPAYFFLWVAVFCGLPYAGVSLFMRLRWR